MTFALVVAIASFLAASIAAVSGFGITIAIGGLAGALLHVRVSRRALGFVFGGLLLLAGLSELTGWIPRSRSAASSPSC